MPHVAVDDSVTLGAILFALAWLGFWIDRQPIASKVPGVPWVIGTGLLLSNSGVIPVEAPAYGFVGQYLLPLGVALLLFKANIRKVFSTGGRVLVTFLIASLGICVGAIGGFFLFDLGAAGAKIAGTYAGAFIGGVVNFVAISQAVEMSPTDFSVALSASAPASVLGLLALVTLPSLAFVRRRLGSRAAAAPHAGTQQVVDAPPALRLDHVAAMLAIGLAISSFSAWLCAELGIRTYNLLVVTVIAVTLANVAPRYFAGLQGDFAVGMLCMYVFFAMIGAGTDALSFVKSAPVLFAYCVFMLGVHFVVLLAIARIARLDLVDVVLGSAAAIVGPAAAAAIASTKGWYASITAAVVVGVFGYVIANFIGIAIVRLLE